MKKSSQNKLIKEEEGRVEYKDYLVKGINGEEKTIEVPVDAYDFLTSDDDTKLTYFNPNEEDEDGYDYLETVNIGFPTDIQHFAKGGVPQNAKWKYPIYFGSEGKEYLAIYYSNEEDVNEADEDFDNRTANDLTPDVIKEFVDDTSSSKSNYKREERDFYELSKNDKFMDELEYALETSSISPEKVDYAKGGEVETKREFIEVVNQVKEENEAFPNDMVNVMDSINAILQDRGYDEFDEYTYDVRQEILDRYEKKVLDKQGLRFEKGGTTYDKGQDNQIEDNTEDIENNKEEIDHYGMASSDALGLAQENEQTIDNMRQGTNKVLNNLYEKNPSLKMAHGGKTPKLKVRKSFYRTTLGANEKTGTGEDMRNVYHLHIEGTGSGQNYLLHSSTVNDEFLKENAPGGYDSGFYVDEEVYVDFTDKDGKKKKGYMLVNNPDLAVRILRDRYGAVSIEDMTMEWEMGDKGKNFEDYTNSF